MRIASRGHALSAFYQSGVAEAAVFTADAVGEWTTTSYGRGDADGVKLPEEVDFPHSLGILYSAVTSFLGFTVNSGEYKVMGLAPYGVPRYLEKLRELVTDLHAGQYELGLKYFNVDGWTPMFTPALGDLLGSAPREPESEIAPHHSDLASSVQVLLEEILLKKLDYLYEVTGSERLCYAGGVALNCVANRRIRERGGSSCWASPRAGGSCSTRC